MDDYEKQQQFDLDMRFLSLIDVSSEDDSLLSSTFSVNEDKSVRFMEPFDASNEDSLFNFIDEREADSQPVESLEQENTGKSGRYNLRKSLAWDKAFLTSEGCFLEDEEMSSMIGGPEKSEKHVLPGIEEDIHRSTDSLSTLQSDTLTLKGSEDDLFEDIRASIQKSSKGPNLANSNSKKRFGATESQTIRSSKKVDLGSRDKMKLKDTPKKPSFSTQGPGKATKQIFVRPQISQSVATNRESTSSLCKPPRVLGRANSVSTISSKRASMSGNRVSMEKDNSKNTSDLMVARRGTVSKVPSPGGSRNIVPRPTPPSRTSSLPSRSSLSSSTATKTELTTSCSSFGSSGYASSDSIGKFSLNSVKRKNESGTCNSGSTIKSIPRTPLKSKNQSGSSTQLKSKNQSGSSTPLKSKNQSGSSQLTPYLRSVTKLSSSMSPSSSISERSSKSSSSTSTAIQRPNIKRASLKSSPVKRAPVDIQTSPVLDSHRNSNDQCSVADDAKVPGLQDEHDGALTGTGSLLCPPSSKPSGLRMPSPKIGFFDLNKPAVRTPTGSVQSHLGLPSTLSKLGGGSITPSGSQNKGSIGKLQPARTSMSIRNTKPYAQPSGLPMSPRTSLPLQESSNSATKVSSVSKNVKSRLISPKFQSRMSPKIGRESLLKTVEVVSKGHDVSAPESPESKGVKVTPVNDELDVSSNPSSTCDAENIIPSQKVSEDSNFVHHFLKKDLHSLKERACCEDQIDSLTKQVGNMHINVEDGKISVILPSTESS